MARTSDAKLLVILAPTPDLVTLAGRSAPPLMAFVRPQIDRLLRD